MYGFQFVLCAYVGTVLRMVTDVMQVMDNIKFGIYSFMLATI
jgi:hypothetical protein